MYFVTGPLTFSWVKVMAKWYHENGIKTPLKVNHFKNYAYLNLSPPVCFLSYLEEYRYTIYNQNQLEHQSAFIINLFYPLR